MGQHKREREQGSQCSLEWLNNLSSSLHLAWQPVSGGLALPSSGRGYAWHLLPKASRCWASGHPQGASQYRAPSLSLPGTQVQNVYFPLQVIFRVTCCRGRALGGVRPLEFRLTGVQLCPDPGIHRCRWRGCRGPPNLLPFFLCIQWSLRVCPRLYPCCLCC